MSEVNKIAVGGKEYTMKDVGILRTKILGTKYARALDIVNMDEWVGDPQKELEAEETFKKFVALVLNEEYDGPAMMSLHEKDVVALITLFFESATPKPTES